MKLLLMFLLSMLVSGVALAAPFVIGDVAPGVTECGVFLDSQPKATVPANNLECRYDVSGVSNGQHSIEMTAIANDPVWGSQESARSAPLGFARPAPATAPGSLRLEP